FVLLVVVRSEIGGIGGSEAFETALLACGRPCVARERRQRSYIGLAGDFQPARLVLRRDERNQQSQLGPADSAGEECTFASRKTVQQMRDTCRIFELSRRAAETLRRVVGPPRESQVLVSVQLDEPMTEQAKHSTAFRVASRQAAQLEIELARPRAQIVKIRT